MNRLPKHYTDLSRDIWIRIKLSYLLGVSANDIAEKLAISKKHVHQIINRVDLFTLPAAEIFKNNI